MKIKLLSIVGALICFNFPACFANNEVGDFDKIDSLIPQSAVDWTVAFNYWMKEKEFSRAISFLERTRKNNPEDADVKPALCKAHISYGDDLCKHDDKKGAMEQYSAALLVDNSNSDARDKLAKLKLETEKGP